MPAAPSIPPPTVGTVIDNGALELVEILGYGGYGVVFKARDRAAPAPTYYAVKCLTHAQAARQRQLHMREIALHKLAGAHPGVVTLHRVVEDTHYTFIVMDYCPDGDLFSQILHHRTYLGYDRLIKHVFLQLIDAVEHCHSLGIYHRDLKPENVLCMDGGLRVAVTDFGLATTDKVSQEFRTGSVYHMSPECQGGRFAPTGSYSPLFNDVWSLGIILLNLATGRNPWKSATLSDPTFYAYLQSPTDFLPTVLPISDGLNALLVRCLEPDWRRRLTLRELRRGVRALDSLYADDVVFEHSMARCPWEASLEPEEPEQSVESAPEAQTPPAVPSKDAQPAKPAVQVVVEQSASWRDADMLVSPSPVDGAAAASWYDFDAKTPDDSASSFVQYLVADEEEQEEQDDDDEEPPAFDAPASPVAEALAASRTWSAHSADGEAWSDAEGDRSMSPSPSPTWVRTFAGAPSRSASSTPSSPRSLASLPPTPRMHAALFPPTPATAALTLDTTRCGASYYDGPGAAGDPYDGDSSMWSACSSALHTAVELADGRAAGAPWAESFIVASPVDAPPPKGAFDVVASVVAHAMDEADDDADSSHGHEADIEDATMAPAASPAALNALAARVFFPPAASASSSGGRATPFAEPVSPAGGKSRERAHRRRGSGRFNPLKLALRSLSPVRTRSRSDARADSASSGARTPSWALVSPPGATPAPSSSLTRPAFIFGAGAAAAFGLGPASTSVHEPPRGRGLRLRPTKRSWFSPGRRLFAAA